MCTRLLSTLVALCDRRFEIFPDWTSRRCALPVSLQFADSPTAEHVREQNRPAMMDSLEDKGAFMTKTKRTQPRCSAVQRRQRAVSLHPYQPVRFAVHGTINENFYY